MKQMNRNLETRTGKGVKGKILLISWIILFVSLFLIFNLDLFNLLIDGDIETVRSRLNGKAFYAYVFMLFVMIAQNSFTVVPLILVITVNITLFGVINGFLWSWFTSVIAGVIVFFCVRYIFQDWLEKRIEPDNLAKIEQKGFIYVFQGRIFPFVPTSLINILAGVSSIRFKDFLLGTAFGNFLFFIVLSAIPAGLLSSEVNEYEMGMILFLVVAVLFALKKFYNKKKKRNTEQPLDATAGQQLDE